MNIHVVIPCAGSGSRAGTAIPKQYQTVAGRAMLWHTLAAFVATPAVTSTLLVLAPQDSWFASQTVPADCPPARWQTAYVGGSSRGESVLNGLRTLQAQGAQPDDWVLVHDAARCLIMPDLLERLISACQDDAVGGLLALPLPDTLKAGNAAARVTSTVPRDDKWLAQTPQMFRLGLLLEALEQGMAQAPDSITDEASAIERMGLQPLLVRSTAWNFKVTYPEDFALAEAILRSRASLNRK